MTKTSIKILFMFFLFSIVFSSKITLPIKIQQSSEATTNYIETLLTNKIYSEISIGSPPQKLNLYITLNSKFFALPKSKYDSTVSSTYKKKSNETYFWDDLFTKGIPSSESFLFNKVAFNFVSFIYISEYNKKSEQYFPTGGVLGLQLLTNSLEKSDKFLESLKNGKHISKYVWNLKYKNDNEGEIIIGEYPHEYDQENFEEDSLKKTNAVSCGGSMSDELCWHLLFTDIKSGENKFNVQRGAEISIEKGVIIGTYEYGVKINGFLTGLGCEKKTVDGYYYFVCDINTNLKSFENLVFVHQELLYNFVLTKDDLFINKDGKKYFLVIFDESNTNSNKWVLGRPFLKKYNFIFDMEKRLLFFYDKENFEEQKITHSWILWVIIGVLSIGVIGMGVLIYLKIKSMPSKKRADEMDDDLVDNSTKIENQRKEGDVLGI